MHHRQPHNIIGGEFPLDPQYSRMPLRMGVMELAQQQHPDYRHALTGGGYYSLKVILAELQRRGLTQHPLLLPSYLCSTLLIPFREMKVSYRFYPVDEAFNPDLEALENLIDNPARQALLFIPYFGFDVSPQTRAGYEKLAQAGVTLIEDRAQCLFPGFASIGHYVFYSFRKFLPLDGSLLLSREEISFRAGPDNEPYLRLQREARQLRHLFIAEGEETEERFLALFKEAERVYRQAGIAAFDATSREIMARMDITDEVARRRELFRILSDLLPGLALLKDRDSGIASPLCFPVRVPGRDRLQQSLREHRIYAPVHWTLKHAGVPATFRASHALANSILSLPLHPRLTMEDCTVMARLVTGLLQP